MEPTVKQKQVPAVVAGPMPAGATEMMDQKNMIRSIALSYNPGWREMFRNYLVWNYTKLAAMQHHGRVWFLLQ